MPDIPHQPSEPGDSQPATKGPRRQRWQVGLRTLILLVAAIAVWTTYFLNRHQNAALEARIKTMLPLAHELIADDPKKVAVVKLEENWFDENRWDIFLPDGEYRLCLAMRGIESDGLATAQKARELRLADIKLHWSSGEIKTVGRSRLSGTELSESLSRSRRNGTPTPVRRAEAISR